MTRPEDVLEGARLGAAYVGVILAEGPRKLTEERAKEILSSAPASLPRVGVFPKQDPTKTARSARKIGLTAVQLHGDPDAEDVRAVREQFAGEVWAVLRLREAALPEHLAELLDLADAVLLDAFVAGKLGGTGHKLPWEAIADPLDRLRTGSQARGGKGAKLVLAGGLRAENVGEAIRLLRPDVVDVSSGVESAPGIKDHAQMRAFRDAVREIR
jgi:phosphoribosylanthranilate isomerase